MVPRRTCNSHWMFLLHKSFSSRKQFFRLLKDIHIEKNCRKCSIKGSLGNPKWLFNGSSMEPLFLKVYSESTYSRSSWLVPPPPQVWACCLISPCSPDFLQIVWVVQRGTDLYQDSLQTCSLKAESQRPKHTNKLRNGSALPTKPRTFIHCEFPSPFWLSELL